MRTRLRSSPGVGPADSSGARPVVTGQRIRQRADLGPGPRAGAGPIDWGTTLVFTAAATAGVGAGKRVADRLEPASMQRAFAALLVAVALYTGARALLALY